MIAALMAYGLTASGFLLLGSCAIELALVGSRVPRRFIWSGAMVLSAALIALAGLGETLQAGAVMEITATGELPVIAQSSGAAASFTGAIRAIGEGLGNLLSTPALLASRLEIDDGWLLGVWGAFSVSLLAVGGGSVLRYRRLRKQWPLVEIEARRMRLSPRSGPAVMGLIRPEIVVPRWLLDAPVDERRLVLAHEQEHLQARDGLLLAVGWVILALCPWNPALWWMLLRLRLAIEIDCDRRVLARGVEKHRYGSMLIDLSAHSSGLSLAVPALAGFPSTLERRLVAMTTVTSRGPRGLRALAATLGGIAVLAACGSEMPTAAEIEALDAAQVELQAQLLGIESTEYYVDGTQVSAEEAKALAADQIAVVEVRRGMADGGGVIHIQTRGIAAGAASNGGDPLREITLVGYGASGRSPDSVRLSTAPAEVDLSEVVVVGYGSPGQAAEGARPSPAAGTSSLPEVIVEGYPAPGSRAAGAGEEYAVSFGVVRASPDATPVAAGVRINNVSNALFLIDGVAASEADFSRLVPSNIQAIRVLKGESATAAYSDPLARNGVVVVTTKSATP
jgi:hypothetical protein